MNYFKKTLMGAALALLSCVGIASAQTADNPAIKFREYTGACNSYSQQDRLDIPYTIFSGMAEKNPALQTKSVSFGVWVRMSKVDYSSTPTTTGGNGTNVIMQFGGLNHMNGNGLYTIFVDKNGYINLGGFGVKDALRMGFTNPQQICTINTNQWHYLAVAYDFSAGEIRFYFDGQKSKTLSMPKTNAGTFDDTPWGIGFGSLNFFGAIDDIHIVNGAISDDDADKLYNDKATEVANLVGWYTFDNLKPGSTGTFENQAPNGPDVDATYYLHSGDRSSEGIVSIYPHDSTHKSDETAPAYVDVADQRPRATVTEPEPGESGVAGDWTFIAKKMTNYDTGETEAKSEILKFTATEQNGKVTFTSTTNPNFVLKASYTASTNELRFEKNEMGQLNGSSKYTQASTFYFDYEFNYNNIVGTINPETGVLEDLKSLLMTWEFDLEDPWGICMAEFTSANYTGTPTPTLAYIVEEMKKGDAELEPEPGEDDGIAGDWVFNVVHNPTASTSTTPVENLNFTATVSGNEVTFTSKDDPQYSFTGTFDSATNEITFKEKELGLVGSAYRKFAPMFWLNANPNYVYAVFATYNPDTKELTDFKYQMTANNPYKGSLSFTWGFAWCDYSSSKYEGTPSMPESFFVKSMKKAGAEPEPEPEATLTISSPKVQAGDTQATVTATVTGTDLNGATITVEYNVNGGAFSAMTAGENDTYTATIDYANYTPGVYTVKVKASASNAGEVVASADEVSAGSFIVPDNSTDPDPEEPDDSNSPVAGAWEFTAKKVTDPATGATEDEPVVLKFNAREQDGKVTFTSTTIPNFVLKATYTESTDLLVFETNKMGQLNGSSKYTQVSSFFYGAAVGLSYTSIRGTINEEGILENFKYCPYPFMPTYVIPLDNPWGIGMADYNTDAYTQGDCTTSLAYIVEEVKRVGRVIDVNITEGLIDAKSRTAVVTATVETENMPKDATIAVEYCLNGGDEYYPMTEDDEEEGLYTATIRYSELEPGEYTVTVRANMLKGEDVLVSDFAEVGSFTVPERTPGPDPEPEYIITIGDVSLTATPFDNPTEATVYAMNITTSENLAGAELSVEYQLNRGEYIAMDYSEYKYFYFAEIPVADLAPDTYTVTVKVTATLGETVLSSAKATAGSFTIYAPAGITDIEADLASGVRFFNLQGVEVFNAPAPGLYIRVDGNKATKVLVK